MRGLTYERGENRGVGTEKKKKKKDREKENRSSEN